MTTKEKVLLNHYTSIFDFYKNQFKHKVQVITEYIFCHKKLIDPLEEEGDIFSNQCCQMVA